MTARYRAVQQLATATHPVAVLCPLLGVSRSGYYGWRQRAPSRRQCEDARLTLELQDAFAQSRRTYGRPRLTRALQARCHRHGERRIGRLMRAAGLCARPRRRFVPQTTDSRHDRPIAPNRLAQRAAPPTRPDEVWGVDLTYIETTEGWLFLAVVLDLHSRKVVGWAFAQSLHTALPLAALRMALQHRRPPHGLLHHSDRGAQYASAEYRRLLRLHGLDASMSRTGNPYDNAWVESFFSTLKTECLHRSSPTTRLATQARAFDYIETFYNRQRLHSALGYTSPVDFENSYP
ncbi:MAG: IS3 family transposase [Chthoniobacteraceae bacterium]